MGRVWQRFMAPERFVLIDETGASTNLIRRYDWALRGECLAQAAPRGHWRTTTFVAGLPSTGLVAPWVLDGPMNKLVFLAYVEQFLALTLQHGDVVVMNNLAVHKVEGVKEAIRAVGASVLYLPDLNPIEPVFAKLKALLRSAAARTKDALWTTIGRMLNRFSPAKCRNYLANSGCEFTDSKNALAVPELLERRRRPCDLPAHSTGRRVQPRRYLPGARVDAGDHPAIAVVDIKLPRFRGVLVSLGVWSFAVAASAAL